MLSAPPHGPELEQFRGFHSGEFGRLHGLTWPCRFARFTSSTRKPGRSPGPARPIESRHMAHTIRIAAVSYVPPAHDHHKHGVKLDALREIVLKVARDKPDFICFPEVCACIGGGLKKG